MRRFVTWVAPPRLGIRFRWLLASSWVSNLGDGIALSAGPLLVASQTRDPLLVASAAILQRMPWLFFGLYAGAVADRFDRKKIIIVGNVVRVVILATLTATIVTDQIGIAVVLLAVFLLGCAETFVDNTANTLLPMIVDHEHLGTANARFVLGFSTINQLAGPSLGAILFTLGMALPFVTQAVLMCAAIGLLASLDLGEVAPSTEQPDLRSEIASGVRWLWAHSPVRTLALTITAFNLTFGAAWSVLVLYAIEVLDSGNLGFGLLTSAAAVGGVLGAVVYDQLERRFRLATLMRAGLIIETATHLGLALTTTQWVAMVVMALFGAHAAVWVPRREVSASGPCRTNSRAAWAACTALGSTAASSWEAFSAGSWPSSLVSSAPSGSRSPGLP